MHSLRILAFALLFTALPLLVLLGKRGPVDGDPWKGEEPAPGHWPLTANTDWCEANYVVTPYIAEFSNSFSSLTIVAQGLYGIYKHWNVVELHYLLAFACFAVVGLGSFLFHATLMREFQLADELPMLWSNGMFAYCIVTAEETKERAAKTSFTWIALITVVFTVLVVLFDTEDQSIFLITYGAGVAYLVVNSRYLDHKYNTTGEVVLLETSICFYIGGFVVWLIDRLYCKELVMGVRVRSLYLHSWWHVGAGIGTFSLVLFWIWTRGKYLKRKKQKLMGMNVPPLQWVSFEGGGKSV